ncbi:MAG: DUF433 domain-containing protein [Bryobacteraceae bacterium]
MPLSDGIAIDPEILAGKPVIRGTRLAVEFILELLAAGQSENDLPTSYPGRERIDEKSARRSGTERDELWAYRRPAVERIFAAVRRMPTPRTRSA